MPFPRRLLVLLLVLSALPLLAQVTGSINGRVTDTSGGAIPGVSVETKSAALQGTRATVTDNEGRYRFSLLPPGNYTVSFVLSGFAPVKRNGVVGLGKDTALDVTLAPSVSGEITVSAAAPIIDTSSSSLGTNLDTRAIDTLPTQRSYASIVQVTPGVGSDANPGNADQSTISVYGSSGSENSFFIDGVNTTGVEYGQQGMNLNFEFIQEVDVKTGGYEAEYGRSTGGIINVITKSGGNDFKGDVFGYYDNNSFQSNAKNVVSNGGTTEGFTKKDYGADLGGYILKDKLWFFAAYDSVRDNASSALPSGPLAGQKATGNSSRDLGSGKLTYNLAPSHSLVATYLQDPRTDTGAINDSNHSLNGDPSTYLGRQDFGGRDYALRYDGAFSSNWLVNVQGARHKYLDASNGLFQTGGFGLVQKKSFDRKFYGASVDRFLGRHDIKAGIEIERETADVNKFMSGGQQVTVFANTVNPLKPIYSHNYWTTPDATVANAPVSQLLATPSHHVTTAYIQDRWSLDNLTINAGLRWDHQAIIDASGVTQIDMKKDYAPRLGFAWDPSGKHSSRVFGSFGRFNEEIPMDLVIRSFSYERQPRIINFSPTSTTPDPAAEAALGTPSAILGGFTEPSDPNIKDQYMDEYILGYENEVRPDISVGVKGIYRSYGRVIEDFLCSSDGTYCIGNPGQGIMKDIFTLDYSTTYPAPKPKRSFKGVQLDANKRLSNNWQAMVSYLYSKLDGNYDGEYAPFTNIGADPNISAAYDYYDFFTNGSDLSKITNRGPLSNDRRHQLKVSGIYYTPFKMSVGLSAYYKSGTPLTRYGYSDAYNRYEFFLTTRGAEGRGPSNYDVDLHLGYPIQTSHATVNVLLDVFSLLNAQRAVLLDERWDFAEADNGSPTPTNPGYGKPILRTPPLTARLGVRVSF